MNKSESERLVELGTKVERLEQKCEDCREMQDERLDTTNKVLGELKTGQASLSQSVVDAHVSNVEWHVKNMRAVYKAALAVIGVMLTVAGVAAAFVKFVK